MPRPISEATLAMRAQLKAILGGIQTTTEATTEPTPMPASANPNLSAMREAVGRGRREGWLSRLWVDEDGCIRVEDAEEEL
jgi:hypothetical protein